MIQGNNHSLLWYRCDGGIDGGIDGEGKVVEVTPTLYILLNSVRLLAKSTTPEYRLRLYRGQISLDYDSTTNAK